jgi:hypothetical protein
MRRTAAILALAAVMAVAGAAMPGLAGAHPLVATEELPVGKPVTVTMLVPAEEVSPMVGIDVVMPASFALTKVVSSSAWKALPGDGATLELSGPAVPIGGLVSFSLRGEFHTKGVVKFVLTTHAQDGSSRLWAADRGTVYPAPVVYAGVSPEPTGKTMNPLTIAGVAILLVGFVVGVALISRRRAR